MDARKKIALIGAGQIGGTLALLCGQRSSATSSSCDIKEGVAKGKALDLQQTGGILGFDAKINGGGTTDYSSSGLGRLHRHRRRAAQARHEPRRSPHGEPRGDHQGRAGHQAARPERVRDRRDEPARFDGLRAVQGDRLPARRGWSAWPACSTPRASSTSSARRRACSPQDVRAMVLGGHGDDMVPLLSYSTMNGIPLAKLLDKAKLDAIVDRTRKGGGEIVKLLGTSRPSTRRPPPRSRWRELPPRPEARLPLRGVPRRRVRLQGALRRRARRHRRGRRREDHPDRADDRGEGDAREVGDSVRKSVAETKL